MRRVSIEDDGSAFSSDEIEYVPVEVDEEDELQASGISWGLVYETDSFLPGETLEERNERLKLQAAQEREQDRPVGKSSSSSAAKDLRAMKRAWGGLGVTRDGRKETAGSPFRQSDRSQADYDAGRLSVRRRGRPAGSRRVGPTADALMELLAGAATACGLSFEDFVRPAAAGPPSAVEASRLDTLAAAVVDARESGATLAAIGAVIGRAPARVSELAARAT